MADEYNTGTNWWNSSRNRFDSGSSSSSSSGLNSLGSFAWPTEIVDVKGRSCMESLSVADSSAVFHDTQKLQLGRDHSGGDLNMMGLGLSSHAMEWDQTLLSRSDKVENNFRSLLQENLNSSSNYRQESGIGSSQVQWRGRMFTGATGDSSVNDFKHINRDFSLDQPHFSPHGSSTDSTVTCQSLQSSFQMDSSAIYDNPSTMFQGLVGTQNQTQQSSLENRSMNYLFGPNYGISTNELLPSWSKVPQFLRNSPPKQPSHNQLHFSNNAPFWNASASAMSDVRPSFSPSLQPQFLASNFDKKPKLNISEARDSNTVDKKIGGSEAATKRPRNETTSPMPPFKVRKEKMGDRITALQQLVSPFGKTDTASVLSEAIGYIKFLHEQVSVLSTPYMKSGSPIRHQQSSDKSNDPEGQKHDLRSRGLCLVPVSSTFPVAQETAVDFWTPTFGGTFK
ncbi:hypothetical protein K2173_010753 [Erythroxylum novogranatense]|uniref:BHLH domain-containing protein n=1 Tax=Erythroxylum novogranatense TaxID=1862640 RepID=A0AAV8SQW3_9ROSI|nr:hypothetical protein K2173_010753 [Erythroxylum novogranatense]